MRMQFCSTRGEWSAKWRFGVASVMLLLAQVGITEGQNAMAQSVTAASSSEAALASSKSNPDPADAQLYDSDLPSWLIDRFTPIHYELSRFVDGSSRSLDGFFGNEQALLIENRSFMRIVQDFTFTEGDINTDTRLRFKLDLPTTRQRLRLILESDDDLNNSSTTVGQRNASTGNRFQALNRADTTSSVFGLEKRAKADFTREWAGSLGAGIRFGSRVDPYLRYTLNRQFNPDNSKWQFTSLNRATLFADRGPVFRTNFDARYPVADDKYLRFLTSAEFFERKTETLYSQTAELNHAIDQRNGLRYAYILLGDTTKNPSFYDEVLQVVYRRDMHKGLVFGEVIPEYHFPRIAGVKDFWALTFRVEVLFFGDVKRVF